ncbi:MAG: ABC transporter permease [Saprospiraceae bacterium]|nr:ABC transporter permease [Saprospiraceae bacterium]
MDNTPKDQRPPYLATRFLQWFLRDDLEEEVTGDLLEQYRRTRTSSGLFRANLEYWYQVIHYLRPFAIRSFVISFFMGMFTQNLRISLRHLRRNASLTWINLGGLALGMMATLLIAMWIYDEMTFDRKLGNYDRIAMAMQSQQFGDHIRTWNSQAMQLAPALRDQYGRLFEEVVTTDYTQPHQLTWQDKKIMRTGNFAEPGITKLLPLDLISGTGSALQDPSSIFISTATAQALFGEEDPLGQSLTIDNRMQVKVAGVFRDFPHNSSFADWTFIAPWELLVATEKYRDRLEWGNSWFQVLVLLHPAVTTEQASAAIRDVKKNNIDREYATLTRPEIFLHPMTKWRLYGQFKEGINTGGRIQYLSTFALIGLFILLLACINFMNLSTAQAETRAREVGIRKTIGSRRAQLIGQFFSESLLTVILSFILAMLLTRLCLPLFNQVTEKQVQIPWSSPLFWMAAVGFMVITTMLAGGYPAIYLSSFRPIRVLNSLKKPKAVFSLRRILVTLQFGVSVIMIIGTVVIFRQINYAKDRPIGYTQDNIITIPIKSPSFMQHYEAVKRDLLQTGDVQAVAASDVKMTSTYTTNSGFTWEGKDPSFSEEFHTLRATYGFGALVNWKIIEGRDFSEEFGTDSLAFILNETAVKYMGLEHPLGARVQWGTGDYARQFHVIGVVKDMITTSPFEEVHPMLYILHYGSFIRYLNVRINPESGAQSALTAIEKVINHYDPDNLFEYQFSDQEYAKKFNDEEKLARITFYFAMLTLFISCIGLLGITTLVLEQRRKEIGMRKILGASQQNLWLLLTSEFLWLVLIACLIGIPLSYYYMDSWLEHFAYRTRLHWWIFALAGMTVVTITLITVSFQILRAAWQRPVQSLQES